MIIPYEQLSPEALSGVIESFINREGTDYGDIEWSLADKVAQIKRQLANGEVVLVFDPAFEEINLMLERDVPLELKDVP